MDRQRGDRHGNDEKQWPWNGIGPRRNSIGPTARDRYWTDGGGERDPARKERDDTKRRGGQCGIRASDRARAESGEGSEGGGKSGRMGREECGHSGAEARGQGPDIDQGETILDRKRGDRV